ncbi:MinD/ParA family protein [Pseudalkalibacillus sp. Hm43]|uniref:MinD/ParA family protein n=1 Tax=Pseudalkalibacillus sp. Hm43 TaxID=3450742 RepID=UPI003F4346F0
MHDQAEMLRKRLGDDKKQAKVCAIASGKGGVGKSNVTVNLAISLAQSGSRVIVLDLDIGMANLDILMGVHSKANIVDLVEQELSIIEIIENGPGKIDYIAGGNGLNKLFQLNERQFQHFTEQLQVIHDLYDYIFLDMGAGASKDSLQFITAADEVLLVTTPEPTAITDAYAMLKFILRQEPMTKVSVIVNRVENPKEGREIGKRIQLAATQFLQKEIEVLGVLPDDGLVFKAVKQQIPYTLHSPHAPVSRGMKQLSDAYKKGSEMKGMQEEGFLQRFSRYFFRKQGAK